jgi:hypothetical protein
MIRQEAMISCWFALKCPPILGLFKSVSVALTYMRHNRTQAEIGESFGVSQPTISRAISAVTPFLARVLASGVPAADALDPDAQYIVDGCFPAGHGQRTRNSGPASTRSGL